MKGRKRLSSTREMKREVEEFQFNSKRFQRNPFESVYIATVFSGILLYGGFNESLPL